eukprot:775533-Prorocentrum_minimum.AAC.1
MAFISEIVCRYYIPCMLAWWPKVNKMDLWWSGVCDARRDTSIEEKLNKATTYLSIVVCLAKK